MDIPSFKDLAASWDPQIFDAMFDSWWKQLQEQNESIVASRLDSPMVPFLTLQPAVVELIFRIAKNLRQPPACRFVAVEIFDCFLRKHYMQLHGYIWSKEKPHSVPYEKWSELIKRLKCQMFLRVMSCLQIASKSVSNAQTLCPVIILYSLQKLKFKYSVQSVIDSEKRVFNALGFTIPLSTILDYVESMIQALEGTVKDCDAIYDACISVLDVVFIAHHQIYKQLLHMMAKHWTATEKEKKQLFRVECDNMFLASSVVVTGVTLREGNNAAVLVVLSAITRLPVTDIEGLAAIITEIILS